MQAIPYLDMRMGSLCSAPPLMLRPRPPTFCRVTCTIRSLVCGAGPPTPLLFKLFDIDDTEFRRLLVVAEGVRLLLFVGEAAESSSRCRVRSSMDSSSRWGSGRDLPSLTCTSPERTFRFCGVDEGEHRVIVSCPQGWNFGVTETFTMEIFGVSRTNLVDFLFYRSAHFVVCHLYSTRYTESRESHLI